MHITAFQAAAVERNYTKHWDLPRWGNALAGEVGEACNIIKKIDRGDPGIGKNELADELADVLGYLVLVADHAGIDLEAAAIDKFNRVSDRIGSTVKIYSV